MGLLSADQLSLALGVQSCGDQIIASLEDVPIDEAVLTRIAESVARRCEVMPLFTHNDTLILAVATPPPPAFDTTRIIPPQIIRGHDT